ncbi:MAG: flagellar export protein FliJ [Campylobacterota bacterium]|nr:flagellar export protein FliJ [Campylobacterota bacterium]
MKTRFSSLVSVKKNIMQKSERALQHANTNLNSALEALEVSLETLGTLHTPQSGQISDFLSNRMLLDSQRVVIGHNQEWVASLRDEVTKVKEQLKLDTMEFEKFRYLELEEIKEILRKQKIEEAKELDEIALVTYEKNMKKKEAS